MRFLLALLALLSACAPNPKITRLDPTPRLPSPLEQVEVYSAPPERPYTVVALWEGSEESSYASSRNALQKKVVRHASALGADAVILSLKENSGLTIDPSAPGGLTPFGYITKAQAQLIVWR